MALYHCNVTPVSRGNGDSIADKSAYISREKIFDIYIGKTYDYSNRQDLVFKRIILPPEAPQELLKRQILINALNVAERRKDSQMARIIEVALPNELLLNEHILLIEEFVYNNFINVGMCADIAIHAGRYDESRKPLSVKAVHERKDNPHAHILIPFRPVDENGFCRTKKQLRYMNRKVYLEKWREDWAMILNREFERRGLEIIVSHKSLAAQGIDRDPTRHLGSAAMALELKGIQTARGDEHRQIIERNIKRRIEREKTRECKRSLDRSR